MTTATKPRMTKVTPGRKESQSQFVARANRELYRKIPDATKRSRFILKCWREAGRDGQLDKIAAEQFPESKFQTIHDLPIFTEHKTVGSDGKPRIYDRRALETIVNACNRRILDTGDFAVLSAGHTPDDPTSANTVVPEVLGYAGPYRLGLIGNLNPKWTIFADEHQRRDKLEELEHRPRRSAEVWLEDNILDPIAALGSETPRLDTGIVRNCRLPSGRVVMKYSAMATAPAGMNTHVQSFGQRRDTYAAGDDSMQGNYSPPVEQNTDPVRSLTEADVMAIVDTMMQSKQMQWVTSQMPPDWSPEMDEVPEEHADLPEDGMGPEMPEGDMLDGDLPQQGISAEMAGEPDGDEMPPDVGAINAVGDAGDDVDPVDMDDADPERYSSGYMPPRKQMPAMKNSYSAINKDSDMTTQTARGGDKDSYSRIAAENTALKQRVEQLEARNRHRERYSRLAELHQTHAFDLDPEFDEVKDLPDDQFERHAQRIADKYSRLPVARGGFTPKFPVGQPEVIVSDKEEAAKAEKYSRRATAIAKEELVKNPRQGITWQEAMSRAIAEIDGVAAK